MSFEAESGDIAVIGAGHAGVEAALAAAKMGCRTFLFALNLDSVANMPCNPSIGGTAKGHLVREVDALGGEMGRAADRNTLQSRMLNRGKGPAVQSLRAQVDRRAYSGDMKHVCERQENLFLKQAEITDLARGAGVWRLTTRLGAVYTVKAVIIATGTFLRGKIYVGEECYPGGPDGMPAAGALAGAVRSLGIPLRRFKTGTPARVLRRSVDFGRLMPQPGDENPVPFSFSAEKPPVNSEMCYITYTNGETRRVILANLHRSPLYSGKIEGVGPRYCPSIEDKMVRFPDKERHQLFIEPCGRDTEEMYLQGMSSSLPLDVQMAFYRTIPGLERVELTRPAYAIEYDCADPTALLPTLEVKGLPGLFGAGQFNGSSGYEEAAAQGIVAGINAARLVKGMEPMVLPRSGSYIGTLIDDLVTKGCTDPYRMMTSRSEYRLTLRQDNADERLTPIGRENGLVGDADWESFLRRKSQKESEIKRLGAVTLPPGDGINAFLRERGTAELKTGASLSELLTRPQVSYSSLAGFDKDRPPLPDTVAEKVETEIKYRGYIERENARAGRLRAMESKPLPPDLDYTKIKGLRLEAVEKLGKIKPLSVGQASGISGVTPADISVLLVWLKTHTERC